MKNYIMVLNLSNDATKYEYKVYEVPYQNFTCNIISSAYCKRKSVQLPEINQMIKLPLNLF